VIRGCLTLPLRLLALLVVAAGVFVAWTYRAELRRWIHSRTADPAPAAEGWADVGLVPELRARLRELERSRRDTIVLSAAEVASLVAGEVNARFPGVADSIQVRLGRDDIELGARVATEKVKLPLGPAIPLVRAHERVNARGRLTFRRAGLAEWQVEAVRLRGLPIPHSLVEGLIRQLSGTGAGGVAEIRLPGWIGGLRAGPGGLVVYGPNPPVR